MMWWCRPGAIPVARDPDPQGFRAEVLRRALATADVEVATDDAQLVERLGLPVRVVPGHADAMKVTTPADLRRAHEILEGRHVR